MWANSHPVARADQSVYDFLERKESHNGEFQRTWTSSTELAALEIYG